MSGTAQTQIPCFSRHHAKRTVTLLASALVAAACSNVTPNEPDGGEASDALLSTAARQLVQQLAEQQSTIASFVVRNADAQEVSGVFALLGTSESRRFNAHHAFPCTAPSTSAETCTPFGIGPETRELSACFTSGCEAAGKLFVEVYTTNPDHPQSDDRIPITYSTVEPYPRGTVLYNPNPHVRWRVDASVPGMIDVQADLAASIIVQLAEQRLDFSYSGAVSGRFMPGLARYVVRLELPRLSHRAVIHLLIASDHVGQHPSTQVSDAEGQILATSSDEMLVWSM